MENEKKPKILITEDEPSVAKMFALKLNSAGFATSVVSSGKEALDVLQKEKFDLVIADLMMAKMDGFALIGKLREQKNNIPILAASALSQNEDRERALKLGADDFFLKSVMPLNELVQKVKNILNKNEIERPNNQVSSP